MPSLGLVLRDWVKMSARIGIKTKQCSKVVPVGHRAILLSSLISALWFAFFPFATTAAVTVASFEADSSSGGITLTWVTGTEINNVGFNVLRAAGPNGPYNKINPSLIPTKCLGCIAGETYTFSDSGLAAGQVYYYRLQSVDNKNKVDEFGPVSASPSASSATATPTKTTAATPTRTKTATPTRTSSPAQMITGTGTPTVASSVAPATATRRRTGTPQAVESSFPAPKIAYAVTVAPAVPTSPPMAPLAASEIVPGPDPTIVGSEVGWAIKRVQEDAESDDGSSHQVPREPSNLGLTVAVVLYAIGSLSGCGSILLGAAALFLLVRSHLRL